MLSSSLHSSFLLLEFASTHISSTGRCDGKSRWTQSQGKCSYVSPLCVSGDSLVCSSRLILPLLDSMPEIRMLGLVNLRDRRADLRPKVDGAAWLSGRVLQLNLFCYALKALVSVQLWWKDRVLELFNALHRVLRCSASTGNRCTGSRRPTGTRGTCSWTPRGWRSAKTTWPQRCTGRTSCCALWRNHRSNRRRLRACSWEGDLWIRQHRRRLELQEYRRDGERVLDDWRSMLVSVLMLIILRGSVKRWVLRSGILRGRCFRLSPLSLSYLRGGFCIDPRRDTGHTSETLSCTDIYLWSEIQVRI